MLPEDLQQQLLKVARESILRGLNSGEALEPNLDDYPAPLHELRAVFVTLKINSALRGCIGTTEAQSPLVSNVANYAYRAAFHDPRFKPLQKDEFEKIKISISILSPAEPMEFSSESDLLNKLQSGIDGLIIEKGACKATFLPSVWESLPAAQDFLSQLKLKANIPAHESPKRAWRYHADLMQEE